MSETTEMPLWKWYLFPESNRGACVHFLRMSRMCNETVCSMFNRQTRFQPETLTTAEIIGQLWHAEHTLRQSRGINDERNGRVISNVVLMGMGEPLQNLSRCRRSRIYLT